MDCKILLNTVINFQRSVSLLVIALFIFLGCLYSLVHVTQRCGGRSCYWKWKNACVYCSGSRDFVASWRTHETARGWCVLSVFVLRIYVLVINYITLTSMITDWSSYIGTNTSSRNSNLRSSSKVHEIFSSIHKHAYYRRNKHQWWLQKLLWQRVISATNP